MSGMRELMPETAAWVDSLRQAFGRDLIDAAMRNSRFVAIETGPDGQQREVRRNDAEPVMVVTRRAWGYRAQKNAGGGA